MLERDCLGGAEQRKQEQAGNADDRRDAGEMHDDRAWVEMTQPVEPHHRESRENRDGNHHQGDRVESIEAWLLHQRDASHGTGDGNPHDR